MVNNSTLMLYLAEIETDLMVELELSKISPRNEVDPYNFTDALEHVGAISADHDLEVSESLIAYLTDMEATVPNALYYFLAGRGQAHYMMNLTEH